MTASTTLTNAVAYDLFKDNGLNVIHVNITKNRQVNRSLTILECFTDYESRRSVPSGSEHHKMDRETAGILPRTHGFHRFHAVSIDL